MDYEDLQTKLENVQVRRFNKSKLDKFLTDCKENSDRVLSKKQRNNHNRKAISYNKRFVEPEDFVGIV